MSFSDGIEHSEEEMEIFFESRRTVSELVAPLGVNTLPLEYMVVEDNGALIYTMCMYIHKLRRRKSTFADTYAQLFNTPGVTSNVFISPLGNEKSSKQLDKRIEMLGSEQYAAMDNGDRNRYRKITGKLADAERYASAVDNGDDQLFKVAFLFTVTGETLDALRMNVNDLHITKKYPSAPKEVIDTYRGGVDNFVTQRYRLAAHGYHVALADCSARGGKSLSAFETIERYRDTTILTAESFSYLGVDYYKNMTSESLNKIFSAAEKYHFVIIDYGTFSPYVKSDIGRCSIKCGVCGSMPWEVNQLRAFADDTRFLSDQMTYLIRGVSPDARTQQTWISDLVDHYLFADIQEDPFDGSCYPALAGLFEKYVKGLPAKTPSEKKEKNMGVVTRTAEMGVVADGLREHEVPKTRLFRRHTKSKPAEERTTEKEPSLSPRINMRKPVSGCWFVASLKHGVGCSYVSAVIANFLAMQNDKVGLITGDEDLREYVSNNVHMYAWGDGADAAFAACTVVVIDGGVCTSLTADQKKELARSSHKYMVCRSGDDYMRVLADFVSTDEWASDKWAYIFNQIPPSDHGKINRLMANYDICYLPSCDARHPAKDVKRSVLSIMR